MLSTISFYHIPTEQNEQLLILYDSLKINKIPACEIPIFIRRFREFDHTKMGKAKAPAIFVPELLPVYPTSLIIIISYFASVMQCFLVSCFKIFLDHTPIHQQLSINHFLISTAVQVKTYVWIFLLL